jgi:putative transposase
METKMQIKYLPKNIYKMADYSLSQAKLDSLRREIEMQISNWQKLKKASVNEKIIAEITGISRAKYYRLKAKLAKLNKGILPPTKRPKTFRQSQIPQKTKDIILQIRRENTTYGKEKIKVILERDFAIITSVSSVGRVLKALIANGFITKSRSACRKTKKRKFNKFAQKWNYNLKAKIPGEMLQIDHMTVSKNQLGIKHFQSWCPITKIIITEAYGNAKSTTAKKFLHKIIATSPYKITSIQVDGGSEFMKDFEKECENLGIDLFVLPPKRPQYNGGVERGNRTFREEFYNCPNFNCNSIGEVKYQLAQATKKYNNYRPHFALAGKTPNEYTHIIMNAA